MVAPSTPKFHYDPEHDTNALARGGSIEDVAIFLCRRGTQDDVRVKAEKMGWWPNTKAGFT